MIAYLRGKLIIKHPNQAVVEVGGVGYEVNISVSTFSELPPLGDEIALFIHTHVREDALSLFGFLREQERQLFEKLIGVTGIGPRLAITILSGMQADAAVAAIKGNNVAALTRVPGIGKKTAERMVLELRDKLEAFGVLAARAAASPVEEDVLSALMNLGFNRALAEKALSGLDRTPADGFDGLFRKALAALAK
jgi:Holliday junction DNA helicase RuvA